MMQRVHSGIGIANKRTHRNRRKRKLLLRHIIMYEPREWTEKQVKAGRRGRWIIGEGK